MKERLAITIKQQPQRHVTKCVFFDRDGVVNASPGPGRYVTRQDEFHLLPAFVKCLKVVYRKGHVAAVVTNQRAVAKGLITVEALADIHQRLQNQLEQACGLRLLDIAYCPHDVNQCDCRKPFPGMLLMLAGRHALDLTASWMVGDAATDIEAGRRAGCRTVFVGPPEKDHGADFRVDHMDKLPALLERIL